MTSARTQLRYQAVPSIGLYLATTKALDDKGNPIVNISWYETKLWVQENGLLLPTSKQWIDATAYFRKHHPEMARDMSSRDTQNSIAEWADGLIAFPQKGNYAPNLNPRPKPGKHLLLIEGSTIDRRNGEGYIVDGGERIELPKLPTQHGELKEPIPELGLISGDFLDDISVLYGQGLTAVVRGLWWPGPLGLKFYEVAYKWPDISTIPRIGFRPARRSVEDDNI